MAADLHRRWWPLGFSYIEFVGSPTSRTFLEQCDQVSLAPGTKGEERCAFDFSEWSDGPLAPEDRPRKSIGVTSHLALAAALRRLLPQKRDDCRHPGCAIVLLPETRAVLKREIAYYRKTLRVVPSAKRYNHPYKPERPDPTPAPGA
jgi:hypothetical protein